MILVRNIRLPDVYKRQVYSPLNGSGLVPVTHVLNDMGITDITIVPEQDVYKRQVLAPQGSFARMMQIMRYLCENSIGPEQWLEVLEDVHQPYRLLPEAQPVSYTHLCCTGTPTSRRGSPSGRAAST